MGDHMLQSQSYSRGQQRVYLQYDNLLKSLRGAAVDGNAPHPTILSQTTHLCNLGLGLGLGFHKIKEIEEKKNSKIKVVTQNLLPKRVTGVGTSSRRAGAVGVEVVGGRRRSSAVVSSRQRCQTSSALSDIVG